MLDSEVKQAYLRGHVCACCQDAAVIYEYPRKQLRGHLGGTGIVDSGLGLAKLIRICRSRNS